MKGRTTPPHPPANELDRLDAKLVELRSSAKRLAARHAETERKVDAIGKGRPADDAPSPAPATPSRHQPKSRLKAG